MLRYNDINIFRNKTCEDAIQVIRRFIVEQFKERSKKEHMQLPNRDVVTEWLSEVTGFKICQSPPKKLIAVGEEKVLSLFSEDCYETAIEIAKSDIQDIYYECPVHFYTRSSLVKTSFYLPSEDYSSNVYQYVSKDNIDTYIEYLDKVIAEFSQNLSYGSTYKLNKLENLVAKPVEQFKECNAQICFDEVLYAEAINILKEKHKDFFEGINAELKAQIKAEENDKERQRNLKAGWETFLVIFVIILVFFGLYHILR